MQETQYQTYLADFRRTLPTGTVARGEEIVRAGSLRISEATPTACTAYVQGTSTYMVELTWTGGQFNGWCSCPAYKNWGPCKHMFATAFVLPQYVDFEAPAGSSKSPRSRLTGLLAPRRPEWEIRLRDIEDRYGERLHYEREPTISADEILVYDVQIESTERSSLFGLQVRRAKRGARGAPTRGRVIDWSRLQPDEIPTRLDQRILREVFRLRPAARAASNDVRDMTVPIENAGPLMRILARSGRCRLRIGYGRDAVLVRRGDVGPLAFELERAPAAEDESQGIRVHGALRHDDVVIPFDRVKFWFLPHHVLVDDTLYAVDAGDALPWLQELCESGPMTIPKADVKRFEDEALGGRHLPVGLLPPDEVRHDVAPRPVLRLESEGGRSHPQGSLAFEYAEVRVALRDHVGVARPRDEGPPMARHRTTEQAALEVLFTLPGSRPPEDPRRHDIRIDRPRVRDAVHALLERDWIVELEGRLLRAPGEMQTRVTSGQDWFELEGGVDYGGTILPLPAVLRAVRRGETFVRLSDGTQGLLPTTVDDVFGVLAELGREEDDTLRFHRSQGLLLDALLAAREQVSQDESFQIYRERLRAFDGVTPGHEPESFQGELRDYQREALGWFAFLRDMDCGGCLADDMGLGKTVQVLALLEARRRAPESYGPTLVVVPRSVVFNWIDEAARFTPELRVLEYGGTRRAGLRNRFADQDLIVTTYGVVRRDAAVLSEMQFDYVILDEAQLIKNPSSQASKAARLLRARHRLALTGTPVENHLSDLWTLFDFLNPGMLGNATAFRRLTKESAARDNDEDGSPAADPRVFVGRAVRPFVLRRTKEQVAKDLPERSEQVIHCEMTKPQAKLYTELRDHYRSLLLADDDVKLDAKTRFAALEALLRLRQAACHTDLVGDAARHAKSKAASGSGKLDTLMPLLEEATESGHRALVFSQFTSFLALVRERLDATETPYLYLDGKTRDRQALVNRFQQDESERVFLISLKAGGLGLNLTAADYVFLMDPWWNPAVEAQAIDRAHRIGQTRSVMAYRLISEDTVEEKVLDLQQAKRELYEAILTEDNASLRSLTREDLELLLT